MGGGGKEGKKGNHLQDQLSPGCHPSKYRAGLTVLSFISNLNEINLNQKEGFAPNLSAELRNCDF